MKIRALGRVAILAAHNTSNRVANPNRCKPDDDAQRNVREAEAKLTFADQIQRVVAEGGECR